MLAALSRHRALPYVLLLAAAASWGGNWVAARAIYMDVPPFTLVFWRWALAALLLLPFAAGQLRADRALIRRSLPALFGFGIIGTAGFTIFGYWGVRYTTAVNATLLNASLPLFMVPLSWLLLRMTITPRQLLGLACSLAGVLAIMAAGDLSGLARLSLNPGDLLLLGGSLLWALYTVLLKWRPPLQPLAFLFATITAGALFTLPFYGWEFVASGGFPLTAKTLSAIGYLAVFPSLIAYICWNQAVPLVGPNVASFFNPLIPVFGTLYAVLLLNEPLHGYHLAGFAFVLGGVWLTSVRR